MSLRQTPIHRWPSGNRWSIAVIALGPEELARRYGLVFEEGCDDLAEYKRAAVEVAGIGQVLFLCYPDVYHSETPIWVDEAADFVAARRLLLAALELTPDAFSWVQETSQAPLEYLHGGYNRASIIVGHTLDAAEVAELPAHLHPDRAPELARALTDLGSNFFHRVPPTDADVHWRTVQRFQERDIGGVETEWATHNLVYFEHWSSFFLAVGPRALYASIAIPWVWMLEEADSQQLVQHCAVALAHALDEPQIIYAANQYDSNHAAHLVANGNSLAEIASVLRDVFGPPAPSFGAISREERQAVKAYLIEQVAPIKG